MNQHNSLRRMQLTLYPFEKFIKFPFIEFINRARAHTHTHKQNEKGSRTMILQSEFNREHGIATFSKSFVIGHSWMLNTSIWIVWIMKGMKRWKRNDKCTVHFLEKTAFVFVQRSMPPKSKSQFWMIIYCYLSIVEKKISSNFTMKTMLSNC